ncbi:Rpn family recombination-promoting nuclease/putative transposase [Candidatus Poribacteria bacterium]|nr:Rpn family recombination-promoting nuclease/putative transposase [Candidatus Poribacteria bacterium]
MELIDFSQLTQINRSFIPNTLREQESDIVFSVPFQHESKTNEILIYILIEHQSTVDVTMGFRLLFYMTQIWDFQRREWESNNVSKSERRFRPILPIVYYTGAQQWKTPLTLEAIMDIPDVLARFVPKFDSLFLSVKETDEVDLTKTGHPLGWLLTVLQKEHADKEAISSALLEAISHINALDEEQAQQRRRAIIYFLLLILHRRPAKEHEDLIALIDQHTHELEVETMAKSMADVLREQGIEQGIEQGQTRAKQEAVLKLLQIQFGDVPEDVSKRITSIRSISSLDSLFEKTATVQTLDEIDWQNYND